MLFKSKAKNSFAIFFNGYLLDFLITKYLNIRKIKYDYHQHVLMPVFKEDILPLYPNNHHCGLTNSIRTKSTKGCRKSTTIFKTKMANKTGTNLFHLNAFQPTPPKLSPMDCMRLWTFKTNFL